VRAAAGLAVLVVLAGCGGGGHSGTPTPGPSASGRTKTSAPSDEERIADVLRDRGEALESGDRRAYLATSTRALRRRDAIAVTRAKRLHLRDVQLDPGMVHVKGRRAVTKVEERYGLARIAGRFETTRKVTLVRAKGRWRVAAVEGRRGLPPWDVADFREHRTPHFVVLGPGTMEVGSLLAALESGYAAMRTRLEQPLRRRYLVIAAANPEQARALTSQIHGLSSLAAISDATISERGSAEAVSKVVSLRLLVVYSAYAGLTAEGRRRTIAHELTHAALAGATSGRTPAWLVEGVAMYVSGDRRPAPPDPDLNPLSRPGAIAKLSGTAQARAYSASSAAAFAIVDRWGDKKLLDLYDSFNDPSLRGTPGPQLVNRALKRELGIALSQLP
jgi:surface antigen